MPEIDINRKLPFSLEAEQAVLGSILIDPAGMDDITGIVYEKDFYLDEHKKIFSAMQTMYLSSHNIDIVTLINELVEEGCYDETGGKTYIALIADSVPVASNIRDYAQIVHDKAILRSLIKSCEDVIEKSYSEEHSAGKLVEYAESQIYGIAEENESKGFVNIKETIFKVFQNLQALKENPEEVQGVKTGYSDLDRVLVGMGKSDLILIGARPGMGKTSFALNIATSVSKKTKKTVCVFSLEMSAEQLVSRVLSSEALVDSNHLRSGELNETEWEKLAQSASELSECDILIDDTAGQTVSGIMSKLRRVKNLGLVVIDYLGLMHSERLIENRVQEVGEISRNLKLLAKEFNVPVICCAQLSRGPESRTDKRPMLSDLRDSGSIEQDADVVMFIYRDEYYKKDNEQNIAEVIVAKNRHGSLETVKMGWIPQYTKFTTLSQEEEA